MTERRPWTAEEDRVLKYLREDEKIKKWSEIARIMENSYQILGRNQKQCRQRYQNHLNSMIVNEKLSDDQERLLFKLHDECGNKWSVIANHFPGRTDNSLKNHFHSKLRGAIRKINRYLGCKKKRGAKNYPLAIVYKIVKYFGQNLHRDSLSESDYSMISVLKNNLLKFAGGNVNFEEQQWEEGNEKKMAERIVSHLQMFEAMVKSIGSRKKISFISEEAILQIKQHRMVKTQEALPQNFDRTECQLFRTFSENSMSERRSSLKESQQRIEIPIVIKSFSKDLSKEGSQPELQFEKLELEKKAISHSSMSDVDSDVKRLVQQKIISSAQIKQPKLQKLTSFGSYSLEMLDESYNEFKRNDSVNSRASNIWTKELDYHMKLDSCIFE